ncbi:fucose-binding lectin II [Streptomyces sp. NPDC001933]|uniref:fucose-binding lectin II n=1 Tax=Streptomyces sp. NPDC001933 TaxID=3364626 RepID=UPI0036A9F2EC
MSEKVYAFVKENLAEISLPAGLDVHVKVKSNSQVTQLVTVKGLDEELQFTGAGERNSNLGDTKITTTGNLLHATFEYSNGGGVFTPSKLNAGGPYEIGNYNILVVVAENGDDSDYNDTILEFSWYTKA